MALRDDDSPVPLTARLVQHVTLVDGDGRAVWGVTDFQGASYAQIRAAAEGGALAGDPTQLYFHVSLVPAGGWVPWDWDLLIQAWDVAWKVVVGAIAANELHEIYGKVRARLDGREVVSRKASEWLNRNGLAEYVEWMLWGDPWSPRDLAGLLGCTVTEAEAVLSLYGYERSPDPARWTYAAGFPRWELPTSDPSARLLVAFRREVASRYPDTKAAPEHELEALFEAMLRETLETGNVRSPLYEGFDYTFSSDDSTPGAGRDSGG